MPIVVVLALGFAGSALAKKARPGLDARREGEAEAHRLGYASTFELQADDGRREDEGLKNGVKTEFHVDPRTDAIIKEKLDKD